jgi:subfamily B ATP-binding cassette protein HlyB/CyaB
LVAVRRAAQHRARVDRRCPDFMPATGYAHPFDADRPPGPPAADAPPRFTAPNPEPAGRDARAAHAAAAGAGPLRALALLARLHHLPADPALIAHQLGWPPSQPIGDAELLLAARHIGLKARISRTPVERLHLAALPALARVRTEHDGRLTERWVLVARVTPGSPAAAGGAVDRSAARGAVDRPAGVGSADAPSCARVLWQDASADEAEALHGGRPVIEPLAEFAARFSGELLLATSRASLAGELARFDFSWFIPALVKYRRLLGEVLAISLFLQLFALVTPLFFQVVMDKVLVHQGLSTLDVLVTGLVVIVLFESLLTALRTHVFTHTTSRIDVELGARLFRHLLQLPLAWFGARRVGDSVARVRELEHIRAFLTGPTLTALLDLLFSVIFIAVMFAYSVPLTLIVLASLPLYAAITLAVVPVLRRRLDEQFARGAEQQALLVETVSGIQTVKAAALEPQMARRWDEQLAGYVSAGFKANTLAAHGHEAIALVGKLVAAATLWFGARLVIEGQLTVGQFVAFSLFAQRVAQPIMRLAQLWTDFQQTGLSMRRLADVLDARAETAPSSAAQLPRLQGAIRFEGVNFRYRPEAPPVLQGLELAIRPGEVIGVVGRSGSGKSTLAKLMQRLYTPETGRVLVDGTDIALIDAAQLRRQIGVVLQDNLLFARSVRENIAIADPAAPLEQVIAAARLAGAHEFICELPEGYDTLVGEHGTGLSGGQRQRIAIARALFTDPRILILDEATSALDYESEAILQRNMAAICRGRTVIVIAHRLSTVRPAHRIVVMERGRIVEAGTHEALLRKPGTYARLWALQNGVAPRAADEPSGGAAAGPTCGGATDPTMGPGPATGAPA